MFILIHIYIPLHVVILVCLLIQILIFLIYLKQKWRKENKHLLIFVENSFIFQIQNDKIEYDKYIKILEENNKKLLSQYENSVKENSELKSSQSSELSKLTSENSRKELKRNYENNPQTVNKMVISTHLSAITLNVNGLRPMA